MNLSENWSEEELKASVVAYIDMLSKEAKSIPFIKKQFYRDLSEKFGRTEKSYEYRMQNISYIYSLMGRSWVTGLKPAKNVGSSNAAIIERLIEEVEGQKFPKRAAFETQVASYKAKKTLEQPLGIKEPFKIYTSVTSFIRDPKVKAWVLKQADGHCECCDKPAPFITAENEPFLEVHHLRRLADRGSDTISNSVALCPNCHREMHYGANKLVLIDSLYKKILRLKRE